MKAARPYFYFLLIFILIVIGTFPESNWVHSTGIDYSIRWLINYLFKTNSELGANMVFPHGPLGLIIYPLPGNILFAYVVQSIIKGLFVFNIFFLQEEKNENKKWATTGIISFLFLIILGITHVSLLVIVLSLFNGIRRSNILISSIGILIASISLYVSAYQGVIAFILFLSSIIYEVFVLKEKKQVVIKLGVFVFGLIIVNLFLFGEVSYILQYLRGLTNLIQDNSSAVAYYPQNNWTFLCLFFLSLVLLVINNIKSKRGLLFIGLVCLGIFAAWKHGMSREDTTHARGFMEFCIAVLALFVFIQKKKFVNSILVFLAFILLSANLVNVAYYGQTTYDLMKAENFFTYVQSRQEIEKEAIEISNRNVKVNQLSDDLLKLIGKDTVDIYPWDYTIIEANNLNWKPRVVIQSYASYTSWLDQQNANHFDSKNAPEFFIWMVEKYHPSINKGEYNSIDGRYLLNDEPKTLIKLLEKYELIRTEENFYLYKKRLYPAKIDRSESEIKQSKLDEWISLKSYDVGIQRIKLNLNRTITQKLKSFFFKDEQYWVSMKLENGTLHNYRIVPKNAADGIWVNPYLFIRGIFLKVNEIRISASNPGILDSEFTYSIENIKFSQKEVVESFFKAKIEAEDMQLVNSNQDFEIRQSKYHPILRFDSLGYDSLKSNHYNAIKPGGYSAGFNYDLKDTITSSIKVHANILVDCSETLDPNELIFVIELREGDQLIKYERVFVGSQIINLNGMNSVVINTSANYSGSNLKVKSYVWNTSESYIKVDNHNVQIFKN